MRAALPLLEFIATLPGRAILALYAGALIGTSREDVGSPVARWLWTVAFWIVLIPFARLFAESWPGIRTAYGLG